MGKTFDPAVAHLPGCFVEDPWEPEEYSNTEVCCRKFASLNLDELDCVNMPHDDWHLSPLTAPDYILSKFPPTSLVVSAINLQSLDAINIGYALVLDNNV